MRNEVENMMGKNYEPDIRRQVNAYHTQLAKASLTKEEKEARLLA